MPSDENSGWWILGLLRATPVSDRFVSDFYAWTDSIALRLFALAVVAFGLAVISWPITHSDVISGYVRAIVTWWLAAPIPTKMTFIGLTAMFSGLALMVVAMYGYQTDEEGDDDGGD